MVIRNTKLFGNLESTTQARVGRDLLVGKENVHLAEIEGIIWKLGKCGNHRSARNAKREAALL